MDRIINVKVNGHYLTKDSNKAGVKGEVNATKLKIWFDAEDESWGDCAKEVVFHNANGENPVKIDLTPNLLGGFVGGGATSDSPIIGGGEICYNVPIPGEAMTEHGWMSFTIQGTADGVVLKSLTDKLFVHDSPETSKAGNSVVPTPTDLEQLRQALEDILKDIYTAQEAARRAEEILEAIQNEDYWAMMSKSYAVGDTGRREGEDTDNSKYYYLLARIIATQPFMLEDDVTGDLYKIGVSDGLLYIEKIAGDDGAGGSDGEPPIEGGDSIVPGSGSISEYIESCDINEAGELLFYTNTGRVLNAGKLPVGDGGAEMFVAELRLEDGVYVSDQTFAEMKEHIEAGDVVVCEFVGADSRTRCHMTTCTDYSATFVMQSVLGADEYFTFTADGVTHMVAESNEDAEEMPDSVSAVKTDNTITVTATYGLREIVTTIVLDDNGYPMSVTKDGKNCALSWEGFDE